MSRIIEPTNPCLLWTGTISIENTEGFSMPWRIPFERKDLFAWPLIERAAMPAGVTLAFRTDSDWIED